MKDIINFLIEVSKLKEMPRTGWVLREVKNPETIADHTFRLAFISWFLAQKRNFNQKRAIKIAFSHDLCEVYAGDITPFLYYPDLPKDREKRRKILMKWTRLFREEKEKKGRIKLKKEREGLLKLLEFLPLNLRKDFYSSWVDYEKGISKEGKFVNQLNRIETLIQSIEYFGIDETKSGTDWWEWVEEIVEDPLLLEFLKIIQNKFYWKKFKSIKDEKELKTILDFLLEIGKLKRMPRLYWLLRGVKNPETVTGHIFTLSIMAWIFGREKPELNMEKLLKMALCHELSAVYTGDTTPYDRILPKSEKQRKEILKKMLRLSRKEKNWVFLADFEEEKRALERLTKKLNSVFKGEMIQLLREYRKKSSPEGYFLSQLNVLAVLFQGLLYREKEKSFSVDALWEWAFEVCEDPIILEFLDTLKEKFY